MKTISLFLFIFSIATVSFAEEDNSKFGIEINNAELALTNSHTKLNIAKEAYFKVVDERKELLAERFNCSAQENGVSICSRKQFLGNYKASDLLVEANKKVEKAFKEFTHAREAHEDAVEAYDDILEKSEKIVMEETKEVEKAKPAKKTHWWNRKDNTKKNKSGRGAASENAE